MGTKTIQHFDPVRREQTNYILRVKCVDPDGKDSNHWEQLWCRKISDNLYEICCIPFFLYNVSFGDVVKEDPDLGTIDVVKPSGHYTFRVWFGDSPEPDTHEGVIKQVNGLGCLFECYSHNLMAIDAPSEGIAHQIADFLYHKQQEKLLIYETGKI